MEFRILGPLEVVADGQALAVPPGQQRALLLLLILNANRVLSAERILDEIWGERAPASGTRVLAFHVSRLRDALAPGRAPGAPAGGLETDAGGYVLRIDPAAIDAVCFEGLAREGHDRLATDPGGARDLLDEALGLWRGEALADAAYAEFAQAEIRRLNELRLGAREDRLEAELALGRHLEAIPELNALLDVHPLRERVRGLLMLALYRAGRQAEALRLAGTGRRLLSEELGIDPSPELVQLESRILAQDPALAAPPTPAARRARNPYKGLRAFGEHDSADFFGREALVGRLLVRLEEVAHDGHLMAVVGPSGSGKSSVVRAGLVPAARARAATEGRPWTVATMVPGTAPFDELAAGLRAAGCAVPEGGAASADHAASVEPLLGRRRSGAGEPRILLVIDQLEELFVRVDEPARGRFLAALVDALRAPGFDLTVVATLRADFLHVPLVLPDVGELIRAGLELVTPMTRAELEQAIARPATAVGVEVEPGLVAEIVADVEHRPGVLPLLQYALTELFERGDGRRLTSDGYAAIGGAVGALGRRADEAWKGLRGDDRAIAKQVLLGLVALVDSRVATACRATRDELESLAGETERVRTVLDHLGRHGLLTFDTDLITGTPTVQIAHEALLVHWTRLADWIEDLREDLGTRRRLADAAEEWEAAARSPDFLAAGAKLQRFEAWARVTELRLTDAERAYLAASVEERTRLARVQAERESRQRSRDRRARLVRLALVGLIVASIVGGSALVLGERQAAAERDAVASANALANGSLASLRTSRPLSVLLALEAAHATADRGWVTEEAYDALQWALQEAQVAFPTGPLPGVVRVAPDGPRGVFLVGPEVLMRLAADYVAGVRPSRALSPGDCRTYLKRDTCEPVDPPAVGVSLGVRTTGSVVPATALATSEVALPAVRVLSELPADMSALVAPLADQAGAALAWDPASGGDLAARIKAWLKSPTEAGDLPDIAIVARSSLGQAAAQGWLLDLDGLVDQGNLADQAGAYLMNLGVVTGPPAGTNARRGYGLPLAASVDDLLWYPARAFAAVRLKPPATLDELKQLVATLQADGRAPWCLGTENGAMSGEMTAAWVEDLLLQSSPADYDSLVSSQLPFDSPSVNRALLAFGALVRGFDPKLASAIYRGWESVDLIPEAYAALGMVGSDTPSCWLYLGSSTDGPRLGARASAVPFPGGATGGQTVLGRAYFVVVLHDRPEVRRLAAALVGAGFASTVATNLEKQGIYPVRRVAPRVGSDPQRQAARLQAALAAGSFRDRAMDLLPANVATGFRHDVCEYLHEQAPADLALWQWFADLERADASTVWP